MRVGGRAQDNMGCVRLIDLKGAGIFAYLDEEIILPKGTDEKFVSKLNQIFDESSATKSLYYSRSSSRNRSALDFVVRHFAGDVTYHAKDFMDKNKDVLAEALLQQVRSSSIPFLVPVEAEDSSSNSNNNTGSSSSSSGSSSSGNTGSGKKKNSSKLTLAAKFKLDLDNLMGSLRETSPHFIRCVKPNSDQAPGKFDAQLTLNQLKYSGLFEAIKIRKAGYAVRIGIDAFIDRYKPCLLVAPMPGTKSDPRSHCTAILTAMDKKMGGGAATSLQWAVGKTRVFIRTITYKLQLERIRAELAPNLIVHVQRVVRGFIVRSKLYRLQGARREETRRSRDREAEERRRMDIEAALSSRSELIYRNDSSLQRKISEAKQTRIRAETGTTTACPSAM